MNMETFFTRRYNDMLVYVCNKKRGGNGQAVSIDDAHDIISTAFTYYSRRPDKWKDKWVWNKLKQLRGNFIRDSRKHQEIKHDYRLFTECDPEFNVEYMEDKLAEYELATHIRKDITGIRNPKKRETITDVLIDGAAISRGDVGTRSVVHRFKKRMLNKYGGLYE